MSPLIAMAIVISLLMFILAIVWQRYQDALTANQDLKNRLDIKYDQVDTLKMALDGLSEYVEPDTDYKTMSTVKPPEHFKD